MTLMHKVSTAGLGTRRRIEYWNELADRAASPTTWDPKAGRRFSGRLTRARIDDLPVVEVGVTPSIVRHSRTHVAHMSNDLFAVKLQLEGASVMRQDGREAWLESGDFTLCDSTRPYELECAIDNRMLVVGIPAPVLRRHVAAPESVIAMRMSGREGVSGLVSTFLQQVWSRFPQGLDPAATLPMGVAILNLIASAYVGVPQARADRGSLTATRRASIASYVERNLRDPDLTPAHVAEACGIKPRYLRKLYSGENETLGRYILRRRLEECARALVHEANVQRTVTDIAFDYGFNSATHFGRVFREHYGKTPKEYRLTLFR